MSDCGRPTAYADAGVVQLVVPAGWAPGTPITMSAESARELAGELLAAALTAKFAPGGCG